MTFDLSREEVAAEKTSPWAGLSASKIWAAPEGPNVFLEISAAFQCLAMRSSFCHDSGSTIQVAGYIA
jgi:hypothetical protein